MMLSWKTQVRKETLFFSIFSMNSLLLSTRPSSFQASPQSSTPKSFNLFLRLKQPTLHPFLFFSSSNSKLKSLHFIACCSSPSSGSAPSPNESNPSVSDEPILHTEVGTPKVPSFASHLPKLSVSDQAFFLLAFIACTVWPPFSFCNKCDWFVVCTLPGYVMHIHNKCFCNLQSSPSSLCCFVLSIWHHFWVNYEFFT